MEFVETFDVVAIRSISFNACNNNEINIADPNSTSEL